MPLDLTQRAGQFENELDFLLHLQNVLLAAVEGKRDEPLDREYRELRAALMADPKYEDHIPALVRHHRDLNSLWPTLKNFAPHWDARRAEVRRQFEPAIAEAERVDPFQSVDSAAWTGASTPASRLAAVRTLLPAARAAVERLIENLETPGHNGGPLMESTVEALNELRLLHASLGAILEAADEGRLDSAYHDGLVAEASRYARRAAKKLRDDPMPYAMSALLLAVLSACGFPNVGEFMSGVAASIVKK